MKATKVSFPIRVFAKEHNMGVGSFNLNDGSSVKILSTPKHKMFHVWQMKNGSIIKAGMGKGLNALAATVGEYESRAVCEDEIVTALGDCIKLPKKV